MKYSHYHPKIKSLLYGLGLITFFAITPIAIPTIANAKAVVGFSAGHIIDDLVFANNESMTTIQIQTFLNSKVPVCDNYGTNGTTPTSRRDYFISKGYPIPLTCLKDYVENGKSSAQIIYDAAQKYHINPQVLIVLLQKEQGLVTDDWPDPTQYRSATGYGCPDTAPCDSQYFGLTNQVNWSARMFRAIMNNSPTWYTPFILGDNFIRWSPDIACGGSTVTIENHATQALYNYTPYQPNSAALEARYGAGDSCSAYGNRNFYIYFTDWFGTTKTDDTLNQHPDGTLINISGKVYIVRDSKLSYIVNGAIFESYGYRWQDIKPATTGDKGLEITNPVGSMRPGSLYVGDTTGVYTSIVEGDESVKQLVSYASFIKLGYSWSQVQPIQKQDLPALTSKSVYTSSQHPDGTLIKNKDGVFIIENNTRRYVSAAVFNSYRWNWDDVLPETIKDQSLIAGKNMTIREGTIINTDSNLYVIDISSTGVATKNPIGPWECYADVYKYNLDDIIYISSSSITNIKAGLRISC